MLDVEGKILWPVITKRLTSYLLTNEFINLSIHKGGVLGFSGSYRSHTAVNLYSKTSKLSLHLTSVLSVVEEFKATEARAASTLHLAKDKHLRYASCKVGDRLVHMETQ